MCIRDRDDEAGADGPGLPAVDPHTGGGDGLTDSTHVVNSLSLIHISARRPLSRILQHIQPPGELHLAFVEIEAGDAELGPGQREGALGGLQDVYKRQLLRWLGSSVASTE